MHAGGLVGILVIFDGLVRVLHVDPPVFTGRNRFALVVQDRQPDHRPRAPHGAGLLQPVFGGNHRGTDLGRPVVLVDHGPPPVEHPLLDFHRRRHGTVNSMGHGRDVVPVLHILGQREQAMKVRGHHVRGRYLVPVDQAQCVLGIPFIHDDDGVSCMDRTCGDVTDGGVIEGRRHEVHAGVVGYAEHAQHAGLECRVCIGVPFGEGPSDPFGSTRRARRVIHDRAGGSLRRPHPCHAVAPRRVVREPCAITHRKSCAGRQARFVRRAPAYFGERVLGHERSRIAVLQYVSNVVSCAVMIDGYEIHADLYCAH